MSKQRIWFIGLALLTGILVFVFMGDQENDRGFEPEGMPANKISTGEYVIS